MAVAGRLTLEEFLRLPEEKPALEYADGEVTRKVSPKFRHGRLQYVTTGYLDRPGLSVAASEARVTFAGRSYVPDVVAFTWERRPLDELGEFPDDVTIPPDIAVEIRSPDQSLREQIAKCRWYVANGVRVSPLIDPITRTVRVFRPDDEQGPLAGDDLVDLSDVIPECRFTVAELFAALRPS
jgi:Uma2 family endonuclease